MCVCIAPEAKERQRESAPVPFQMVSRRFQPTLFFFGISRVPSLATGSPGSYSAVVPGFTKKMSYIRDIYLTCRILYHFDQFGSNA